MRFETTPPPAPNWEKHLEPEVSAQIATGCEQTKRELDEYAKSKIDPDPENDGLEVVK